MVGDGCAKDIGGVVVFVDGDLRTVGVGDQEESDRASTVYLIRHDGVGCYGLTVLLVVDEDDRL